jgi:4-amino-4-deoxy-L-arabinose transferase-like glycosyltransferase
MTAKASATRLPRFEAWVIALVCFGLRAVSLVRSCLSDDEAIYAVVAREMLAGRTLYRDVVDHKPPLVYVVYALTQAVGGPRGGMLLLHLLTIAVVFATALILRCVVREFAGLSADSRAPFWAALLYAVFTTTLLPFDALAANCELFMMLPLSASVLFFLRGARSLRLRPLLAAGGLVGIAALFKYQAGVQLALYAASLTAAHWRRMPRVLLAIAAIGVGVAAALGVVLAVMQSAGSLDAAWFWFRFNFGYIKTGFDAMDTLKRAAIRISFVVCAAAFLWVLAAAAALKSGKPTAPRNGAGFVRFAALWALVSALAITTGGRFFGHYFHQITAPLAVLAAPVAAQLWRTRRHLVAAAVGLPAAAFLLLGIFQTPVFAAAGEPAPDYQRMVDLVNAHARPGDGLLVWGNLPVLYFVAERPLGTRFVFSNYMTGLSPATPSQSDPSVDASPNIVPASWAMFEADVAERRPRVVVDTSPGNVAAYGKFPPSNFPRLQALLDHDYRPVGETAGVRVFVRQDSNKVVQP